MNIEFARQARQLLEGAGFPVEYHESDGGHFIDPDHIPNAVTWLRERL
jgi:predicted esterase